MLEGEIAIGDRLIWEPMIPGAYSRVRVVGISEEGSNGETWIETEDDRGWCCWNVESRVREACIRDEARL
jgi:hypothetical protein